MVFFLGVSVSGQCPSMVIERVTVDIKQFSESFDHVTFTCACLHMYVVRMYMYNVHVVVTNPPSCPQVWSDLSPSTAAPQEDTTLADKPSVHGELK